MPRASSHCGPRSTAGGAAGAAGGAAAEAGHGRRSDRPPGPSRWAHRARLGGGAHAGTAALAACSPTTSWPPSPIVIGVPAAARFTTNVSARHVADAAVARRAERHDEAGEAGDHVREPVDDPEHPAHERPSDARWAAVLAHDPDAQ